MYTDDNNNILKGLNQRQTINIEYIWLGGFGHIRSKTRTIEIQKEPTSVTDIPKWDFNGLRTYQSQQEEEGDIVLVPVSLYNDPFRGGENKLVLCETYHLTGEPTFSNFRHFAAKLFNEDNIREYDPWFGIEQEYILVKYIGTEIKWPFGWTPGEFPKGNDEFYCANGDHLSFGRPIIEAHFKACLYSGVDIYGINSEFLPSQWEFQVGTSRGIKSADDLILARFILIRIAEAYDISISFEAKLFKDWCGSGGHTNFSCKETRAPGGLDIIIQKHMPKLEKYHKECIALYGEGNKARLMGMYDAPDIDNFEYGIMNRRASIRIPQKTNDEMKGFYEDRRPAANLDPYIVMSLIFSIACLNGEVVEPITRQYDLLKNQLYLYSIGKS
jgi:glutamine synthetase